MQGRGHQQCSRAGGWRCRGARRADSWCTVRLVRLRRACDVVRRNRSQRSRCPGFSASGRCAQVTAFFGSCARRAFSGLTAGNSAPRPACSATRPLPRPRPTNTGGARRSAGWIPTRRRYKPPPSDNGGAHRRLGLRGRSRMCDAARALRRPESRRVRSGPSTGPPRP